MARSTFTATYATDVHAAKAAAEAAATAAGFSIKDYHGEQVWKKGTGFWTAMKFMKFEYGESELTIHGWVQAGLGSVGGSEMDLEGFVAALPKSGLKKTINKIAAAVQGQ